MALPQNKEVATSASHEVGFTFIKLMKDDVLGSGSYGTVYKASCDDLVCAAKIMHHITVDQTTKKEHFENAYEFLTSLRHPNIVLFLGFSMDQDTNFPILLMELMDESLTWFLESGLESLPFHIEVNICHDVALALSFLHSNGIIHRNLSSNNVLMIGNVRAKVTDFSMGKLWNTSTIQGSLSKHPSCSVYMPPEEDTNYSNKLDCFSFGVLSIQILTCHYPQPSDPFQVVEVRNQQLRVPERERRKSHLDLISSDHPILPLALNCIQDKEINRPLSSDICSRLLGLKKPSKITNTDQQMNLQQTVPLGTGTEIQNDPLHSASPSREQEKYQYTAYRDETCYLTGKLKKLKEKDQLLQASEQRYHKLQQEMSVLEKKFAMRERANSYAPLSKVTLKWKKDIKACLPVSRTTEAIISSGNVIFICLGGTREVHAYNIERHSWSKFPDAPTQDCSLTLIKQNLTVIGGKMDNNQFTNKVMSLIKSEGTKRWMEIYPQMEVKRSNVATALCPTILIVAGGENELGYIQAVEVLDTTCPANLLAWTRVADLPEPLAMASATICGGDLCILGGWVEKMSPSNVVYSVSITSLPHSQSTDNLWKTLGSFPMKGASCVSAKGHLLAVGGRDIHQPSTAVHIYNPKTESWEFLSSMLQPRHQCFATVLDNKLVVMGGWILTKKQLLTETRTIEIADIL